MIADIWTMIWKEWKEYVFQRGGLLGGSFGLVVLVAVFGIYLPPQFGREWVESPLSLVLWAWVPMFLVIGVIADSFAGERERHTLETLLATRLSDRAILLGKLLAAVAYGWGFTVLTLVLGLATVNVAFGDGELLMFPLDLFLGILGLGLLVATLAATTGVLVSLRASTARQAQQLLSIVTMVLLFGFAFGAQALPEEWKARLTDLVLTADVMQIVLAAATILLAIDIGLFLAATARFQRTRLILD